MASVNMTISLIMTVVAALCQTLATFLPGWLYRSDSGTQIGVWYSCVNWKNCYTLFDNNFTLDAADPASTANVSVIILIVTQTLGVLLLLATSAYMAFAVCCSNSSLVTKRTVAVGLNVSACFIITTGILLTVTSQTLRLYGGYYGFGLAISASGLSLLAALFLCCDQCWREEKMIV